MTMKDDNELVQEVIHGSISSFEVLIDRYQKTVFNMMLRMTCNTETAKDLTQEAFVKAFEKMGGFDFRFRFYSWIYRIAVNEMISWSRKRQSMERLDMCESLPADMTESHAPETRTHLLRHELLRLDPDYRILILLKYFCGLSYQEINEVTGIPLKKVRSRLFIAREQLRKKLIANGFFESET